MSDREYDLDEQLREKRRLRRLELKRKRMIRQRIVYGTLILVILLALVIGIKSCQSKKAKEQQLQQQQEQEQKKQRETATGPASVLSARNRDAGRRRRYYGLRHAARRCATVRWQL